MKKAMKLVLAMAMVVRLGGAMAAAQETGMSSATSIPSIEVQGAHLVNIGMFAWQAKDNLFADTEKFAQGASSVTEINLDPKTMGMVVNNRGRDADLAKRMQLMVVHAYSYDKPGMYRAEDLEKYRKKLEDGSWSCSIHVRTTTGSTDICSRSGSDSETNEMVILAAEPKALTFIHMSGKMSLAELGEMGGRAGGIRTPMVQEPFKVKSYPPPSPKAPTPPVAAVPPVAPEPPPH
jgi:hypothetical protein